MSGQALSDNLQMPLSLDGYVQVAINNGLFEAYPAEARNGGNGQFEDLPGPRLEPVNSDRRSDFAQRSIKLRKLFMTGG